LHALVLYVLLTPALFYLFSRATITKPLWSWYERKFPRFGEFASCPACIGTHFGFACGIFGHELLELPFLGIDSRLSFLLVGLCASIWTPIVAAAHERALRYIGGE
jgi:hypothetical protein